MTHVVRFSLVAALMLNFLVALPAAAEIVERASNVLYNGAGSWQIDDGLSVKSVLVADKALAKRLAKLSKFGGNQCIVTYENDSKVVATNGEFYYVLKISKCL